MPLSVRAVSPQDVAVLVHRYLQQGGFKESRAAFEREASELLERSLPPHPGQSIKSLPAVLNEYAALLARAEHRANFERSFGDEPAVRSCLSKMGVLLDDYVRLRDAAAAPGAPMSGVAAPGAPTPGVAAPRAAAPGGSISSGREVSAEEGPSTAAPAEAAGTSSDGVRRLVSSARKRKATQPRRRLDGCCTSVTHSGQRSRELFGNLLADRINLAREPDSLSPPQPSGAAGRSNESGTAAMGIDEIVRSLLDDPSTLSVLSSRPEASHAASQAAGQAAGHGASHAASRPAARDPAATGESLLGDRPRRATAIDGTAAGASDAPAATGGEPQRLPADLDLDSFLSRVHNQTRL